MFTASQIDTILTIAKDAGDVIMDYYHDYKDVDTKHKDDNSPVTKADLAANDVMMKALNYFFPNIAIVSEENSEALNVKAAKEQRYFMIDPLDGTSSFIKKSDEFTVNIALIDNSKALFGAIYLPAKDVMYFTNHQGQSHKIEQYASNTHQATPINTANNQNNLRVICTKREPEKSIITADLAKRNMTVKEIISISSSYKFCLIAEGKADLYPRRVHIKAWDVAAGHAIVNGANGHMIDYLEQKELRYQCSKSFDMPFFEVF